MKRYLAFLVLFLLTQAYANSFSYGTDIVNRYIFRGIDFGDPINYNNPKGFYNNSPAVQPTLAYSFDNGLAFTLWGSGGLGSYSSQELDELDLTASYPFSVKDHTITLGYTHYTFPSLALYKQRIDSINSKDAEAMTDSDEAFIGVVFNYLPWTPGLTVYQDYDKHRLNTVDGSDRSRYTYTELSVNPPEAFGMAQNLMFSYDGTFRSAGLTNVAYKLTKALDNGFSFYTKLIYIPGSNAGVGMHSSSVNKYTNDDKPVWDPINTDNYEIVFGLSYLNTIKL